MLERVVALLLLLLLLLVVVVLLLLLVVVPSLCVACVFVCGEGMDFGCVSGSKSPFEQRPPRSVEILQTPRPNYAQRTIQPSQSSSAANAH